MQVQVLSSTPIIMKKINKILICGGGSAGWMTASALAFRLPQLKITLLESPGIKNIGVGESTLGHINQFFHMMNMNDKEWMPACNATYKNSIQFTDFYKKDTRFQFPFGNFHFPEPIDNIDQMVQSIGEYFKIQSVHPENVSHPLGFLEREDFARYFSFNAMLAEYDKITTENVEGYDFIRDTAYHLNADLLGQYLKKRFCKKITHVEDDITEIKLDDTGITRITCNDTHYTDYDLYIDCTGFKSILLRTLERQFFQFPWLINDKAVTARIPFESEDEQQKQMHCVTDCKGINAGWLWSIPLWDRMGKGYVYSSQFLSEQEAEGEFRKETGWQGDVKQIPFKSGYMDKSWYKNVVGIGLASGFIEPLESTGLLTTHENIIKLVRILEQHNCHVNSVDKTMFNSSNIEQIEGHASFISLHYGLSRRDDTPYWQHVTEIEYDNFEGSSIVRYNHMPRFLSSMFTNRTFDFSKIGMTYIIAGMGLNPTHDMFTTFYHPNDCSNIYHTKLNNIFKVIKRRKELIKTLPTHHEFLKTHIYH